MPRISRIPTLYDEVLQIHLSKLKQWKYLKPNQRKNGTITWSRHGRQTGRIGITVNTWPETSYLELNYTRDNEPRNYRVSLVAVPSNLGKGKVWYFLCPQTGKRCRKLYCVNGYFLHREAFPRVMYETQTYSENNRQLIRLFEQSQTDKAYNELYSKHFKSHYAGKPTKRYLRIMEKIQQAERFSAHDIQGMYCGIIPKGF